MTEDQLKAMEASAPLLVAEVRRLRAELAKHQESEFHPDWSLLQASRESLREHMAKLRAEPTALEEANKKLRVIHEAMEVLLGVAIGGKR